MIKSIADVYDEFLGIQTEMKENDSSPDREIFIHYVPTRYSFIEDLFIKYPFEINDHIVDFGCGKGRVLIMAAYHSCRYLTGYEIAPDRYKILLSNIKIFQEKFSNTASFSVFNDNVEKIKIPDTANKFFFYKPFHLKIHMKVIKEIQNSLHRNKREIYIFFYRPHDSTIKYIDSLEDFEKIDVIDYSRGSNLDARYLELVVYTNKCSDRK